MAPPFRFGIGKGNIGTEIYCGYVTALRCEASNMPRVAAENCTCSVPLATAKTDELTLARQLGIPGDCLKGWV